MGVLAYFHHQNIGNRAYIGNGAYKEALVGLLRELPMGIPSFLYSLKRIIFTLCISRQGAVEKIYLRINLLIIEGERLIAV
jgi:hypothetical protein